MTRHGTSAAGRHGGDSAAGASGQDLRPEQRSDGVASLDQATIEHAAVTSAMEPIVTINASGQVLSASDSIEKLLGWKVEDLVGRNVSVLMPEPHRARHDGYLANYLRTGHSTMLGRPRQIEAVHRDGRPVPIELCVSRADVPGSSEPLFVGLLRHASQRGRDQEVDGSIARLHERLAEQTAALQAAHLRLRMADRMASVGTLSAGLGHDMQNVLLPVRAHLEALAKGVQDAALARHVEPIQRAVDYLQQLSDGLHFLVLDPDRQNLEQETSLHRWWQQTGAILTKAVPRHVRVQATIPGDLPAVHVPPHRLTQAVLNLVVNSGEAIPPDRAGQVTIAAGPASPIQSPDAAPMVRLVITDNGEGMPADVARRAFDLFFTTKPRGMGTGLGLALVRSVAEQAGGTATLQSAPGKGTSVQLLLPAKMASGAADDVERKARIAILCVADGRASDLMGHFLRHNGVAVRQRPALCCNPASPLEDGPGQADLWILDPLPERLEPARRWRNRNPRGGLVLFGLPPEADAEAWEALHPIVIAHRTDLDALRDAMARAATGHSGGRRTTC